MIRLIFGILLFSAQSFAVTSEDLHIAARDCDIKKIRNIVKQHIAEVDINFRDFTGATPIINAASCENPDGVKLLAGAGADLNIFDYPRLSGRERKTALMHAAVCFECTETLAALIQAGADLNLKDSDTALTLAIREPLPQNATLLVNSGADVNITSPWMQEKTPLMLAIDGEKFELAKLIIEKGADLDVRDKNQGFTALHLSLGRTRNNLDGEDFVKYLIGKTANLEIEDFEGMSPIFWADSDEMVKYLVGHGANINHKDKNGRTIFYRETYRNRFYMDLKRDYYLWLIAHSADVNSQDILGETPLMMAAKYRHVEGVQVLVQAKANLNLRDKIGQTAITHAKKPNFVIDDTPYWKERETEIVDLLLKNGGVE